MTLKKPRPITPITPAPPQIVIEIRYRGDGYMDRLRSEPLASDSVESVAANLQELFLSAYQVSLNFRRTTKRQRRQKGT